MLSLHQDPAGCLWVGTYSGLGRYNGREFRIFSTADGLASNTVLSIGSSADGQVWVGTTRGLCRLLPAHDRFDCPSLAPLPAVAVQALVAAGGSLLVGSAAGLCELRPPTEGGDLAQPQVRAVLADLDITRLARGDDGSAWIGTRSGLLRWYALTGQYASVRLPSAIAPEVSALLVEPGRVWIGSSVGLAILRDGGIVRTTDPLLSTARVLGIREDLGGNLWFTSIHRGLLNLKEDGSVRRLGRAEGLSDEIIWDADADSEGGLWVGSNGDGLLHISAGGEIRQFTREDGLPNNFVWSVLAEEDGVWASTNRGLARLQQGRWQAYSTSDGPLNPEGAATVALRTRDGERWFGAATGLVRYAPDNQPAASAPPAVLFERVRSGDETITSGAQLGPSSGNIEFEFADLALSQSSDLRYRYRLSGGDGVWSSPASDRPITYAALAPGRCAFEVQASLSSGSWGPSSMFEFAIEPSWWRRPLTLVRAGLALLALVTLGVRLRLNSLEASQQRLEQKAKQRTLALADANRRLEHASLTDPLTGLANRRYLNRQIQADVAQCRRAYRQPPQPDLQRDIVLLMADVDHFKQINDRHGHAAGDAVLQQFAQALSGLIRESDYAVRWGGEEFLMVARNADARQAGAMAERIVSHIRDQRFRLPHGAQVACTCSIGVAALPLLSSDPEAAEWEQVVNLADAAAFLAKRRDRDGWAEASAVPGLSSADVPDLLAAAREDIKGGVSQGLLELRGSQRPLLA